MSNLKNIESLSPLPIVNLDQISAPIDGLLTAAPGECAKLFAAGDICRKHYEALAESLEHGKLVQCPHGFTSCVVKSGEVRMALTSMIPFPRQGGDKERKLAKQHPEVKLTVEAIARAVTTVKESVGALSRVERDTIKRQSVALHEIRKLNAKVKQSAERLCYEASPGKLDEADARLVQIWKCAELMSQQFEVIELLANEDLAALPLQTFSNVYRIFDKCVHVYAPIGKVNRLELSELPHGYSGRIRACDKTLPIIPSALIGNALTYSLPDTKISIQVSSENNNCVVRMTNMAKANDKLDERVFEKGVSLSPDHDSTGNGLHLVKIVAIQHQGKVGLNVKNARAGVDEVTFSVTFPELNDSVGLSSSRSRREGS